MNRLIGILSVLIVVILAMAFAAGNVGHMATLNLGLFTLYRVPVTMVAFLGLVVGMLVMFATGVHSDLKVRRILRDRLAEETRNEQVWIDRNQRDLFAQDPDANPGGGPAAARSVSDGDFPDAGAEEGTAGGVFSGEATGGDEVGVESAAGVGMSVGEEFPPEEGNPGPTPPDATFPFDVLEEPKTE